MDQRIPVCCKGGVTKSTSLERRVVLSAHATKGSAQNRANLYAKPFASHETAVELVLAVEEDVVPPDRADMGQ